MDEVHSLREEHRWHTNQVVVGDLCLPCVASCIQRGLNLDHCLGALLAVLKDHVVLASTVLNHTPDVLDALLRALVHAAAVDTGANNNNNNNNNGDPAHPQSPQACLRCFLEKPLNTPHTTAALAMLLCSQVHAMRGGSSKKMVALLELLVDTLVDAGPDACQHLKQHGDALLETMAPLVATLPSRLPVLVVLTLHKQGVLHLPSLSPIHRVRLTEGVCHALPERTRQPHDSGPYAAVLDLITLRGTQLPLELLQTRRCADALRSLLHSADNDVAEVTVRLMHNACTSGPHARAACAYFQTAQLQEDVWAVARRASTATATTAAATADTTTSKEADSATTCEASNAAATPNLLGAALTCALALTYNSSPARFLAALTTATQLANSRMTRRDDESTAADAAGAVGRGHASEELPPKRPASTRRHTHMSATATTTATATARTPSTATTATTATAEGLCTQPVPSKHHSSVVAVVVAVLQEAARLLDNCFASVKGVQFWQRVGTCMTQLLSPLERNGHTITHTLAHARAHGSETKPPQHLTATATATTATPTTATEATGGTAVVSAHATVHAVVCEACLCVPREAWSETMARTVLSTLHLPGGSGAYARTSTARGNAPAVLRPVNSAAQPQHQQHEQSVDTVIASLTLVWRACTHLYDLQHHSEQSDTAGVSSSAPYATTRPRTATLTLPTPDATRRAFQRALLTTLDAAIPTVLQHTQFFVSTEMQHAFFQLVGAALEIAGRADTGAGAAVAAAGVMGHGHTHRQHVNTTGRGGGGGLQREMEQARHVELAHASRYPSNHKRASNNHNSDGSDDSLLATRLGMGSAFATKLVRAGFIELCLMTARLLPDHRQRSAPQIGVLLNVLSLAMAQDDSSSGGQRNGDSRAVRRGGGGGRGPDTGVHVRTIAHALDPASIATVLRRGLSAVLTDKQAIPRTVSSAMGTVGQRHNGHRHHHQQSQQQHTASVVLLPGPTGVAVLMLYLQLLLSPTRMTSPFAPQQQREYAAALDQFLRTHAQRKWPLTPLRHIAHIVARLALYSSGTQGLAQTLVLRADELQSSSDQHHCRGGGGSGVNRQDDEMTLKMVLWVLCHPDLTAMQKKEALAAFQPTIHAHLDHPDVKALATAAWFSSLFLSIVQSARVDLVELVLLICGQHKSVMELPANPAHIFDALHARANQSPVDRGAKETAMVLYTCQRALTDALNQLGDRDAVLACHPLLVRILSTSDAGATNQDALSSYCLVVQRWACLAAYLDREQARHRLPPIIADVADRMWAIRRIAPTPAADAAIAALVALDSIQHTRALATLERLLCEEEELWTLQTTEALALQNLLLQQYHFRQQQQQCSDGESDNSADRQVCASTAHATPGSDARMRQRLPALAMRTLNRLAGMTASPVDVGATIAVTSACVSSSSQHIFSNSPWIDTILADMAEASTPKLTCLLVLAQQLLDQRPSVVAPYLLQAASACSSVLEMVDAHQPVRTILAPILDDVISRVRNGGCGGLERWDWPIKYELPQGTEQSTALDPRRPHKLPNANILPLAAILPCTLTAV